MGGTTFLLIHIQGQTAQLTRLQGVHGSIDIHQAAPTHIHDDGPMLHGLDAAQQAPHSSK